MDNNSFWKPVRSPIKQETPLPQIQEKVIPQKQVLQDVVVKAEPKRLQPQRIRKRERARLTPEEAMIIRRRANCNEV